MFILFFNNQLDVAGNNIYKLEDFSSKCSDISCIGSFPLSSK
jgi:hypothetical protein